MDIRRKTVAFKSSIIIRIEACANHKTKSKPTYKQLNKQTNKQLQNKQNNKSNNKYIKAPLNNNLKNKRIIVHSKNKKLVYISKLK